MKSKTTITKKFTIQIPKEEMMKALAEVGYEIPEDAYVSIDASYGPKTILHVSWSREEDAKD